MRQDVRNLLQRRLGVRAEMVRHPEDDLDGEVVQQEPRHEHHGRQRRHLGPQAIEVHPVLVLLDELPKAIRHVGIELPDVAAVELDDVHVDEGDVGLVALDALPRGAPERLEVVRKRARSLLD